MPVLDGLSAAGQIAEQRIAPVVILTAFSQRDLVERARDAGAMAYLVKPFTKADLVPAIEMAVSRFQEARALEDEVVTLRDRLEVRKLLDRAKGLLQSEHGLTEPEAFRWIQKTSMDRGSACARSRRRCLTRPRRRPRMRLTASLPARRSANPPGHVRGHRTVRSGRNEPGAAFGAMPAFPADTFSTWPPRALPVTTVSDPAAAPRKGETAPNRTPLAYRLQRSAASGQAPRLVSRIRQVSREVHTRAPVLAGDDDLVGGQCPAAVHPGGHARHLSLPGGAVMRRADLDADRGPVRARVQGGAQRTDGLGEHAGRAAVQQAVRAGCCRPPASCRPRAAPKPPEPRCPSARAACPRPCTHEHVQHLRSSPCVPPDPPVPAQVPVTGSLGVRPVLKSGSRDAARDR